VVLTGTGYPHLLPAIREFADGPDALRIRRIRTDRWVSYARAEYALGALEELLEFPKRTRMPNLLLVGPSNNGKTMIIEKFRRDHPSDPITHDGRTTVKVPVLKVQMPAAPDERRFFSAIVSALGTPERTRDHLSVKQDTAVTLMRATDVDILILDEVHNLLCGTRDQQRRILNLLRWLGNELQIPIVGAGTAEALRAIHSDEQLANRFTPLALPPWRAGAEFTRLVGTLEAVLPLKEPSGLSDPRTCQRLLSASEGILGEVVTLLSRAAVAAIEAGDERIAPERLETIDFVPPSQRRHVALG
jgi:Bacterial TniB protein